MAESELDKLDALFKRQMANLKKLNTLGDELCSMPESVRDENRLKEISKKRYNAEKEYVDLVQDVKSLLSPPGTIILPPMLPPPPSNKKGK